MTGSLIVIGSSGHAKVLIDIIEKCGAGTISGLIDDFRPIGEETLGYRVIGTIADIPHLIDGKPHGCIIAIGDNWARHTVHQRLTAMKLPLFFPALIHPSALIGKAVAIGEGTVIMPGTVINSGSRIGCFSIVNSRASVDHDDRLGDFSSLAPGVTLGGNVMIGPFSAIAIGTIVTHAVTIGAHTVIGAGSLVLRDIGDRVVAYGSPARIVRTRQEGERYL